MREHEIQKKYYQTFVLLLKAAVEERTSFWELDDRIHIPECMEKGSFKEAVELMRFNTQFDFLMTKRAHNVQNHIKTHVNRIWNCPKEGERVVTAPNILESTKKDYMD